jgi:hypothetical protein
MLAMSKYEYARQEKAVVRLISGCYAFAPPAKKVVDLRASVESRALLIFSLPATIHGRALPSPVAPGEWSATLPKVI